MQVVLLIYLVGKVVLPGDPDPLELRIMGHFIVIFQNIEEIKSLEQFNSSGILMEAAKICTWIKLVTMAFIKGILKEQKLILSRNLCIGMLCSASRNKPHKTS